MIFRTHVFIFTAIPALAQFESVAIGIKGPGFVAIAADAAFRRGILAMDDAVDKIVALNQRQLLCAVGDSGDSDEFCEMIRQSLNLHQLLGSRQPRGAQVAQFVRRELVVSRRERRQMPRLKLLLASADVDDSSLYWLDETGATASLPFAAHGLGSALVLGHLDREYQPDLTPDAAIRLLSDCLDLLRERYAASTAAGFIVKLVTASPSCTRCFRWSSAARLSPLKPPPPPTMCVTTFRRDSLPPIDITASSSQEG